MVYELHLKMIVYKNFSNYVTVFGTIKVYLKYILCQGLWRRENQKVSGPWVQNFT